MIDYGNSDIELESQWDGFGPKVAWDIGVFVWLNLLVFHIFLQHEFGGVFSYIDEGSLIVLALIAALRLMLDRKIPFLTILEKISVCIFILFLCLSLAGGQIAGVQANPIPVAIDVIACSKTFFTLVLGLIAFKGCITKRCFCWIMREVRVLVFVMFACSIINAFFYISLGTPTMRYGLYSFSFIYYHPTALSCIVVGFLILLSADDQLDSVWTVMCCVVLCATLRSKAIGFALVVVLFIALRRKYGYHGVGSLAVVFGVICAPLIGLGQVRAYYGVRGTARFALAEKSFDIAEAFFPFGSGFGTYGSAVTASSQYYSSLYDQYGLSAIQGLTREDTSYVSDVFWPTLLAQFGLIGMIAFIVAYALVFVSLLQRSGKSLLAFGTVFLLIYLLISSTSESAFFNPQAVYLSIVWCISYYAHRSSDDTGMP